MNKKSMTLILSIVVVIALVGLFANSDKKKTNQSQPSSKVEKKVVYLTIEGMT